MTEETLNIITYVLTGAVIIAIIIALLYFQHVKNNDQLIDKRRWIETLPSIISSIGVLGTFAGITLGLYFFNEDDLDKSIPFLLGGLKTAFFTSLAGMIGSMFLSWITSSSFDAKDKGVSDINIAAGLITQSVGNMEKSFNSNLSIMQQTLTGISEALNKNFLSQEVYFDQMKKYSANSESISSDIKQSILKIEPSITTVDTNIHHSTNALQQISDRLESMTISLGNVEEGINNQSDVIKSVGENVAEIVESSGGTYNTQSEIIDEIKKLSPVIRDEVTEIEEKMNETNILLTQKFEEFSELLKKSNTEALVEVMKGVTEEFEKQMNALISKLIQENFEQLNQSVANMIQWQKDNKDMIESLTNQYFEMATDFEETSTTLHKVGDDTKLLVSDGGKLHQIIDGLEQVMSKDKDFVATAELMRKAAEMNEENMRKYEEYTRNLNVWVQKQRDFVEGVKQLIHKLDELDKLRDFNNDFWKETKEKLEEALGLMNNGAFLLKNELKEIDEHFYARLNETLHQLDTCIQAMITSKR